MLSLSRELKREVVVMRPTLILGPGDWRLSSCRSVYDFLKGDVPLIPAGGLSIVDVRDCAAAFIVASKAPREDVVGRTFLLGDYNMTFYQYFNLVSAVSKVRMPLLASVRVSFYIIHLFCRMVTYILSLFGLRNETLDPVVAEMSNVFWYLHAANARKFLRFQPRPLAETLYDTVTFLQQNLINKKKK